MRIFLNIIIIILIGNSYVLKAQNLVFFGTIPVFSHTFGLSEQWDCNIFASTTIDAVPMRINEVNYPAKDLQLYLQPSIIFTLNPAWSFTASYTYQRNNPITEDYTNEHRLWEQVSLTHFLEKLRFSHRLRVEERFIENRITEDYPFALRLRYQFSLTASFAEHSPWYWTAYNEWYASVIGVRNADYSENWTYVGVGYKFSPITRLEAGYLLQFLVRDVAKDIRVLNLLQVIVATNIPLFQRNL